MPTIRELKDTIEEGRALEALTQSYSEISAAKLKRIRRGIEQNRVFYNEIASLYFTIKQVAETRKRLQTQNVVDLLSHPGRAQFIPQKEIKKTLTILLTSNYRFYGILENNLIRFYVQNSNRASTDHLVVGKTGAAYLKEIKTPFPFDTIVFEKDIPTETELSELVKKTRGYDRILVFHSQFRTVLYQAPFIRDITQAEYEAAMPKHVIDYIFEPEIDKILAFFDTQISGLMLEQTFLESELARTAARLISMDTAETNAQNFIAEQELLIAQEKRSRYNTELLETIASSLLSQKKGFTKRE